MLEVRVPRDKYSNFIYTPSRNRVLRTRHPLGHLFLHPFFDSRFLFPSLFPPLPLSFSPPSSLAQFPFASFQPIRFFTLTTFVLPSPGLFVSALVGKTIPPFFGCFFRRHSFKSARSRSRNSLSLILATDCQLLHTLPNRDIDHRSSCCERILLILRCKSLVARFSFVLKHFTF